MATGTLPLVLFAPGAGKPSSSDWMRDWAARLAEIGTVVPFDHPYQEAGRGRPDRMPKLVEHARGKLRAAQEAHPERPVLFAGKSMGSRVACHLSLEEDIAGIVAFGYPLAGGGKRDKLRDEVLVALRTPILFLQGTRDKLAPLDLLEDVRQRMSSTSSLHIVPTGDHSLLVTKTHSKQTGRTQRHEDDAVFASIQAFVAQLGSPDD